jgi:hypothetical protein
MEEIVENGQDVKLLPEKAFVDLTTQSLKGLSRDDDRLDYLLEVLVHNEYSRDHYKRKAKREFLFRKDAHQAMVPLSREEFDSLKENPGLGYGLITYSFAFRDQDTFDLVVGENWRIYSEGVTFAVKVRDGELLLMEDTVEMLWMSSPLKRSKTGDRT